jgi:hypothetical protein
MTRTEIYGAVTAIPMETSDRKLIGSSLVGDEMWWRWFRRPKARGFLTGDGQFTFPVVGTSFHQTTLEFLFGKCTPEGRHRYAAALLTPQPDNPRNRKAVAVIIHGLEVGFLEREVALDFLRALHNGGFADAGCEALIVGGWNSIGHDWGYVGIRLNTNMPFSIHSAAEWHQRTHRSSEPALPTFLKRRPP